MELIKNKINFIIIVVLTAILLGVFFRVYNLNWGSPFYFHPDERNIASSVAQLKFPDQMNPNFFAYGSLPIYAIYFTGVVWNITSSLLNNIALDSLKVSFVQAIIISRVYSLIFSLLILFLFYKVGKLLRDKRIGYLALLLASTSAGLVQYSHFGTFEMWLSGFSLLLFYFLLSFILKREEKYLIFSSIVVGLLVSIKISSLIFFPIPLVVFLFHSFHVVIARNLRQSQIPDGTWRSIPIDRDCHATFHSARNDIRQKIPLFNNFKCSFIKSNLILASKLLILPFLIFAVLSPYVLLDFSSFNNSLKYESSVALGTLPVFYTQGFYDTISIFYQFMNVFPFLLNPILTIIFVFAIFYLSYVSVKERNLRLILLILFFLITFLSQAFLFVKWTRYMVPSLPFAYLIISLFLIKGYEQLRKKVNRNYLQPLMSGFLGIIFLGNLFFAFSFFTTVYLREDTRVSASLFAKEKISPDAKILSEVYDLGIVPFNQYFYNIKLYNFYDMDLDPNSKNLLDELQNFDYIILPSPRVTRARFTNPKKFPISSKFYSDLFSGKLGYDMIYKTPCDIFCKTTYLGDPVFSFEETTNVFDRPTLFIFEKSKNKQNFQL